MEQNKEETPEVPETPEKPKTALEAFYQLFAKDKHPYETDADFTERKAVREVFIEQLKGEGLTPEDFYARIATPQLVK